MTLLDDVDQRIRELTAGAKAVGLNLGANATPGIRGWSNLGHAVYFDAILATGRVRKILVCGVYHGADLAIIAARADEQKIDVELTGIDLFEDKELPDWPEGTKGKTWQQAHHVPPPNLEIAQKNCPRAKILIGDAGQYLVNHAQNFDFIYLDTSHDYETTRREILAVLLSNPRPILLGGDDYETLPNHPWGVKKACLELIPNHKVFFHRCWLTELTPNP